ncbi:Uncharacterized protein FWK35_00015672 [Aphis craccivora]|uniref:Uncharacterized protein n=1 Tax=Aphis craccivora TaxID=307492 RepID=A0A6G0Y9T0_APHCR|nr:Uncharacterized protein FWK35_00015672 [Aphis craccivora]
MSIFFQDLILLLLVYGHNLHDFTLTENSERSYECIDFTMLCVCVHTRTCRNNVSISNYGGSFRWQNESSWCIGEFSKASGKIKKTIKEKLEFLLKTSFRPNRFFYMMVIPYDSNLYEIYRKREIVQRNDNDLSSNDFKYLLLFENVDKIFLAQSKYLKI